MLSTQVPAALRVSGSIGLRVQDMGNPPPMQRTRRGSTRGSVPRPCGLLATLVLACERNEPMNLPLVLDTFAFCPFRDRAATARRALAQKGGKPTSSYRGVTHHVRTGRWEAHIWLGGKQVSTKSVSVSALAYTA